MRLAVHHTTHYAFERPVGHGLQRLRLTPKSSHGQRVLEWTMRFEGAREEAQYDDHHHNWTTLISVFPGATAVTVSCTGTVDTPENGEIIDERSGYMPLWAFHMQTPLTRPAARLRALVSGLVVDPASQVGTLHALSAAVLAAVPYGAGRTDVRTTAEEALAAGHGVCQDHAHVFIGAARLMGFPARYVSGYLMMNDRIEQEAGHAWAEAYVKSLGWVGFDVSNGISPDSRYVRVATGCDYRDAAPVNFVSAGAGESSLTVSLTVEQLAMEL